ncbi:DUF4287 domain-containing protein [Prauserella muralis]|uniref:Uncharacterized protein n=1 Tax=Prauserella muralis TaxID=588067 RepID=A0A2V4AZL9_9PSEU|nr:DUF4287 domain-containing protein [Prauserella muralis]PXY27471.1 hypothetical protein BAY60_13695 [Prauserella muralis]TWE22817.1 uncharacterized protein DUF4287 [Prauserella muralis]
MIAAERDPAQRRPGLRRATGRDYAAWFAVLDEWGAPGRPFREIAGWLRAEHGMSAWWAQKLIVEYEQARGLRPAGVRPDGTFTVGSSATMSVPVERLYAAVVRPGTRERWLPGIALRERTARPHRSVRFDWAADGSRVSVTFEAVGAGRSRVAVEHEHLPDPATAERLKAFWRERLSALRTDLEDQKRQES